jgi:outer membrane protein OmpA-like peptidoglycan-associated protein
LFSANFGQDLVVPLGHTIFVSSGPNGRVIPLGTRVVNDGDTLDVTVTPNTNYHVVSVVVDGVDLGPTGSFSFSNVKSDHTISATFELNTNGTPGPGTGGAPAPIVPEGSDGVKATVSGTNDPVILSLIQGGGGVQISAKDWMIQIASDKKEVYGIELPTKIQVFLIRGVNATTSGNGFLPGTLAKVYLYSTRILLGEATVQADGTFAAHFPVNAQTTLGHHIMQVEGTAFDGKFRAAAVGLQVIDRPTIGLVHLANIYYNLNVSDLSKANNAKLDAVAKTEIKNNYRQIWIYGYTDIQTGVNNTVLSKMRALKVIRYLHKLLPKLIVTYKFFGPANPLNRAKTQLAYAQNRRTEILGKP